VGRLPLRISGAVAAAAVIALTSAPAFANGESKALIAKAAFDIYSLDRDSAIVAYRQAVVADPDDAAAFRGLASALWLSITFRRCNMTVDDYIGKLTRSDLKLPPPPAEVAAAFRDAVDQALALGRKHVAAKPTDPEAHFQLGSAIGLRASYVVTVDGSILGGVRAARGAYDEHEKVLELDPKRADAGLIVGTYRYLVSAMALPMRWVAYMAGFGGGKEKGMQLIRGASEYPGENQTDARLALLLVYNREGRYDDALAELAKLRELYPRNRIFWLETGATNLRAGRAAEAERFLNDGIARLNADDRQRMFGEPALWYYKRGAARVALGHTAEAAADLKIALASEGRPWVYGRTHLEMGKLALKSGGRADANSEFRQAIALCDSDNDALGADDARHLLTP
jgi:tetratricopeptide (TPR) repeat protein